MSGAAARAARCDAVRGARSGAPSGIGDRLLVSLLAVAGAAERARQRRRLRALAEDPAFLKDIGISRADALREASRPFWRR